MNPAIVYTALAVLACLVLGVYTLYKYTTRSRPPRQPLLTEPDQRIEDTPSGWPRGAYRPGEHKRAIVEPRRA